MKNIPSVSIILRIAFVLSACVLVSNNAMAEGFVKDRVEMQCGSHRVAITCGRARPDDPKNDIDTRICVHSTLSFTGEDGKVFVPKEPSNVVSLGDKGNSPQMMNCGKGADGKFYAFVRFEGCPYVACEMYDLFSESGKRLTVNSVHLQKTIRRKLIKFSETGWHAIEAVAPNP
jgi:hypothetical protein